MRTWPALKVGRPDSPDGLDLLHAAFLDYRIAAIDDTSPDGLQVYFNRVLSSSVGAWQTWPMKRDTPSYHEYRFPPEIISHAVWLYHGVVA